MLLDDICYEVMSFLSTRIVLDKCLLISKQFYNVAITRYLFSIDISEKQIFRQFIMTIRDDHENHEYNLESSEFDEEEQEKKVVTFPYYENIGKLELELDNNFNCQYLSLIGGKLKKLTSLVLKNHYQVSDPNVGLNVINSLGEFNNLRTLHLTYYDITDEQVKVLCGLPICQHLTELDLSDNEITNKGPLEMSKSMKSLTHLKMTGNYMGTVGFKSLTNLIHLKSLEISLVEIEDLKLIVQMQNLTKLTINEHHIGDEGLKLVSSMKNLTTLNCEFSGIGPDGTRYLSSLINLTEISLSGNSIGPLGAKSLTILKNLTTLHVFCCDIQDEGAKSISSISTISSLSIFKNNIGLEGITAICTSLHRLRFLSIDDNPLGNEGAEMIGLHLQNLEVLSIEKCNIGDEGIMAICNGLSKHEQWLVSLYVSGNNIGDGSIKAIISHFTNLNFIGLDVSQLNEETTDLVRRSVRHPILNPKLLEEEEEFFDDE